MESYKLKFRSSMESYKVKFERGKGLFLGIIDIAILIYHLD
jgi:hypothetical protein